MCTGLFDPLGVNIMRKLLFACFCLFFLSLSISIYFFKNYDPVSVLEWIFSIALIPEFLDNYSTLIKILFYGPAYVLALLCSFIALLIYVIFLIFPIIAFAIMMTLRDEISMKNNEAQESQDENK
jgi:hypothetical protein